MKNWINELFGKSIEDQESEGQAELVATSTRLPIQLEATNKEREDGSWGPVDAKDQYERWGIEVVGPADDIFYGVLLPDGWRLEATDHPMWSKLFNKDGLVAMVFYKAAIYDRRAFLSTQI